jgi:ribosome-associated toxin RatA of RatAB toxin-antitoxin module
MALVEGPFSRLQGLWSFTPVDDEGCKVELVLEYELKRGLASAIIASAFSRIANTMVSSFCDRANELYEH